MTFQGSILRAIRGPTGPSLSLSDDPRYSFDYPPTAPQCTPLIPTIFVTSPEEEGGHRWLAVDGDELDAPIPDFEALEATIEQLRTLSYASDAPTFRRPKTSDTVVMPRKSQEGSVSHDNQGSCSVTAPSSADSPPTSPTGSQVGSATHPATKNQSLRKRASQVLKSWVPIGKADFEKTQSSAAPPSGKSDPLPATHARTLEQHASTPALKKRRSLVQIFGRNGSSTTIDQSSPSPLSGLYIYTSTETVTDGGLPEQSPTRESGNSKGTQEDVSHERDRYHADDKPLPALPIVDSKHDQVSPPAADAQTTVETAAGPTRLQSRKYSLQDLRQKWINSARPGDEVSSDHSADSSGSSGAESSRDSHLAHITRSHQHARLDSLHFDDLHFDASRF